MATIKPYRMHAVHRCDLLLHASVCLSVCVRRAQGWAVRKWMKRSRCRLRGWLMWVQNTVLDGSQDQTNLWVDNTTMRPFAKLLWTLICKDRCSIW